MSDIRPIRFPRFVDSQPLLLFWELDEAVVYVLCLLVGIVTRELVAMAIIGFIVVKFFGMWKSKRLDGVLMHLAHRHLAFALNKRFRNGEDKDFIQ